MKHTKSYIKGHPNPNFTRKEFLNLDGKWDFAFDDADLGKKNKYYEKFPKELEINVPFSYETVSSGIHKEEMHKVIWYKKEFSFDKGKGKALLHFEGVDYLAEVWLNGKFVGRHEGAYTRFSFDVTDLLKKDNVLVVRCYDDFDCTHSRGKQRWMDHNYECFYVQTSGIWKSVWIEKVGESYLESVRISPSYKNTNCEMEYVVKGELEGLELETIISFEDYLISDSTKKINRNIFSEVFDICSDKATMKLHCWNTNCPALYDVEFILKKNGKEIDRVASYFGVAENRAVGRTIYENRNTFFARLILDQGYTKNGGLTLTEDEMIQDISLMKEVGFNGCRKHQKIEADLFYYYCDILGFRLWEELPSAYEWRAKTILNLTHEFVEILNQHHNHPCVMANVIVNESWGTMSIADHKEQQRFAEGLYYLGKALEPNHFMISNDGWEATSSDLINLHDYSQTYEQLMSRLGIPYEDVFYNRPPMFNHKVPFDDLKEPEMDRPMVLTEFGGVAFAGGDGWGYGDTVKDEEEYLARIKGQVDAIFDCELFCGFCYTQLSDVQQEINGIVDEDRKFKADKKALREIFDRQF